jgi:hypothetical protein
MRSLAAKKKWIRVHSIGKTVNRLDTPVIQFVKAGEDKPNIWIEAGLKYVRM